MEMKRRKCQLSYEELRVRNWIKEHRGVLTQVALACDVCHQFVQHVAYGTSHTAGIAGPKVEKALRKKGWPGIRRRIS